LFKLEESVVISHEIFQILASTIFRMISQILHLIRGGLGELTRYSWVEEYIGWPQDSPTLQANVVGDSEDEIGSDEEASADQCVIFEADSSDAVVGEVLRRVLAVDNEFFVIKVCLVFKIAPRVAHGCNKYEISTNQQIFKGLKAS
jgi:hypothetical protein